MSCLGRAAAPVKRVWRGISVRLRRRRTTVKSSTSYVPMSRGPDNRSDAEIEADDMDSGVLSGLGRLRKDVRTCEYSDVHVMWEMLSSNNGSGRSGGDNMPDIAAGKATAATTRRTSRGRKPAACSRLLSYCCAL